MKQLKKKYIVNIYNSLNDFISSKETYAVSEKQAINNVRCRFDDVFASQYDGFYKYVANEG